SLRGPSTDGYSCGTNRYPPDEKGADDNRDWGSNVDSFGTWRDLEGRLVRGVDDFDEAYPAPYTNHLVRLAASVKVAIDLELLEIRLRDACDILIENYRSETAPRRIAHHARRTRTAS